MKGIFFFLTLMIAPLGILAQSSSTLKLKVDPAVQKLHARYQKEQKSDPGLAGYRVQIYNGRKQECQEIRAQFLQLYPSISPYLLYESPEYRVQVGDFRTALEAERFRREINEDFEGCFVLETRIKLPKLGESKPRIN